MSRVVVVGGGLGGTAAAARLAKLGHAVTLLERGAGLGGAAARLEQDGHAWDAGPRAALLPAALRDLFRKTGRPLDAEVPLVHRDVVREHRFADGTAVVLPGGSRAVQLAALDGLRPGLGTAWCDHVASYAEDWDLLRRHVLERRWDPDVVEPDVRRRVLTRTTVARRTRRTLRDRRLREMALTPLLLAGQDPRTAPGWLGMEAYLEQQFGVWEVEGDLFAAVPEALQRRLATRGVEVRTGTEVTDVVVRGGRAVGVATVDGVHDADLVVCAVDVRRLPALAEHVRRTLPAMPPVVVHLGLAAGADLPDLGPETVLHGEPTLVVRTGGLAPAGGAAWTVLGRGKVTEDLVLALARHRVDVREAVVTRLDLTARDQAARWAGSPYGTLWQGRSTLRDRLGPLTPVPGVYACGANAAPGAGVPLVLLGAAQVAAAVGPA